MCVVGNRGGGVRSWWGAKSAHWGYCLHARAGGNLLSEGQLNRGGKSRQKRKECGKGQIKDAKLPRKTPNTDTEPSLQWYVLIGEGKEKNLLSTNYSFNQRIR